jgi:tetratricopeptide (TPR) repeat protein
MSKPQKRPRGWLAGKKQINEWLNLAKYRMANQDYDDALRIARRILKYIPKTDAVYAETLGVIGTVLSLQKDFEQAYQTLTQAVKINPDDSYLWFNRGQAALFTSRTGQAVRDLEQAVRLEGAGKMAGEFRKQEKVARHVAESERAMRGKNFTLDQLIEQQELFQQGNNLSMQEKWLEAENCLRRSIAMGDCLPQPWGNMGICLAMQNRFDEAEAAYKRALEIDPRYKRAKENLDNLEQMRAHPDEKPGFAITSPFQDVKTNIMLINE